MFGSAESEHPMLTNGEIISDVFQPMWSQSTNVTDRQTDRQTDDMRSQYRALHYSASRGKNVKCHEDVSIDSRVITLSTPIYRQTQSTNCW